MKMLPSFLKTLKTPTATFSLSVDDQGETFFKLRLVDGRKMRVPIQAQEIEFLANILNSVRHSFSQQITCKFGKVEMTGKEGNLCGELSIVSTRVDDEVILVVEAYHVKTKNYIQLEVIFEEIKELAIICRDVLSTLQACKAA